MKRTDKLLNRLYRNMTRKVDLNVMLRRKWKNEYVSGCYFPAFPFFLFTLLHLRCISEDFLTSIFIHHFYIEHISSNTNPTHSKLNIILSFFEEFSFLRVFNI